jgi:phospholipid transport system substrate-binding protein
VNRNAVSRVTDLRGPDAGPADERNTVLKKLLLAVAFVLSLGAGARADTAPDAFVRTISNEVLDTAKSDKAIQAGDIARIVTLVDTKVMPHVNFEAVTRSAVGPQWRQASPEQRTKLQTEFKTLLVRVYAGALTQIKDQTTEITKTQAVPNSSQVVVQSEVKGKGEPIKLDYRLDKVDAGWKIIDVNVGGIWLVTSYRSQFAQELTKGGIDGLINTLVERNAKAAGGNKT